MLCCSQVPHHFFPFLFHGIEPRGRRDPVVPVQEWAGEVLRERTSRLRGSGDAARVARPVYCGASDSDGRRRLSFVEHWVRRSIRQVRWDYSSASWARCIT